MISKGDDFPIHQLPKLGPKETSMIDIFSMVIAKMGVYFLEQRFVSTQILI